MTSEPVGSLAEEAAKLIAVVQGWAHQPGEESDPDDESAHADHDPLSAECRYCPLCAVARTARSMSPEVRDHLASAALSLALAFKGFLDDAAGDESDRQSTPVEKIDLAED